MSKNPQQTAYMYASSRVRALENGIVGKDRIEQLVNAAGMDEVYARLSEFGVELVKDADGCVLEEQTLEGILVRALADLIESAPAPGLFDFLRYPYDCHNIKAAIKSYLRGLSPDGMLSPLGTVDAGVVAKMPVEDDFSLLPEAMAKAAPLAMQAYAKTANPRQIDLILDKACYADMLSCAKKSGEPFHLQMVQAKIDLTNLMICLRLVRMQAGEQGALLLDRALLDGGILEKETLIQAYGEGEAALVGCLVGTVYEKFTIVLREQGGTAAAAERLMDDYLMELVRTVKYTTFGAPVLSAYFYAQEYAIRNIRIVLAAKRAGLAAETIRERIRTNYV
ncbi:MAG: hypothetical protein E7594_01640 [Ruminococcaceae bacterium]|nr:hypothetical protein [Oscillospiraceae bacterium]